jgi:hypothetical protein
MELFCQNKGLPVMTPLESSAIGAKLESIDFPETLPSVFKRMMIDPLATGAPLGSWNVVIGNET